MRTFLFPPSKPKPGQPPWVTTQDGDIIYGNCPGFKWRGKCHHLDEVRSSRVVVATMSAMDKARVLEALQTQDDDFVKAICLDLYPSMSDLEIKTFTNILLAAFEDEETCL